LKILEKYLLVFVILALLALPALNSLLGIWNFERRSENRTFQDTLSIDINHLDDFPKEAEAYVNDNFPFRTPLLNHYHQIKFSWYHVSPHPDQTIVGNEGWYFMSGKEKDIYEGKLDFSDEKLSEFEEKWQSRMQYFDSLGIKAYWLIGPMKHNVYPEYLPFNIYTSKKPRRVASLKTHLDNTVAGFTVIDPTENLKAHKEDEKLYYMLDNHWNYKAGELVSQQLMTQIEADFPDEEFLPLPNYTWKDSTMERGIHYNVIAVENLSESQKFPVLEGFQSKQVEKYGFPIDKGFPYPDEFELRYINPSPKAKKRILFIRDSFTDLLIPFIKEPFAESVFIFDFWEYKLNPHIIEEMKPDIVVFSGLEVHIESVLKHY